MKKKYYHLLNKTFEEEKVKNYKELWTKLEKLGYQGLQFDCFTLIKRNQNNDSDNSFHTIFSDAKEDRHGDIVRQDFDLKSFKKNPVLLDSHDNSTIESIIGKVKGINVKDNKLQGDIIFAKDENPRGQIAFNLANGGFLNTTSIGFIPKEFDEKTGDILKSELLEISAVGVPANPRAIMDKIYEPNKKNIEDEKDNGEAPENGGDGSEDGGKEDKQEAGRDTGDGKDKENYSKKEFEAWDNGDQEVRYKTRDIAEFEEGSFKKEELQSELPRIFAMTGVLKGDSKRTLQSLFFPKSDGWTFDDAKKWVTVQMFKLKKGFEILKKEMENWDNGDNEVRYKTRDIAEFEDGTLNRVTIKTSMPRIEAIVGRLKGGDKMSVQTLFFPKADGWTIDDAKKWVTVQLFELLGARDNETDSINLGKEFNESINKSEKPKKKLSDILEEENNKKVKIYNKIYHIVKTVGEANDAEQATKAARKSEISMINKCIRELIHNKK